MVIEVTSILSMIPFLIVSLLISPSPPACHLSEHSKLGIESPDQSRFTQSHREETDENQDQSLHDPPAAPGERKQRNFLTL